jgi:hypothetical protein
MPRQLSPAESYAQEVEDCGFGRCVGIVCGIVLFGLMLLAKLYLKAASKLKAEDLVVAALCSIALIVFSITCCRPGSTFARLMQKDLCCKTRDTTVSPDEEAGSVVVTDPQPRPYQPPAVVPVAHPAGLNITNR